MFLTAYSTTAGAPFFAKDLPERLGVAKVEGVLTKAFDYCDSLFLLLDKSARSKDIPPFEHPVQVARDNHTFWVVDLRAYQSRIQMPDGSLRLPTEGPAHLNILRAQLEQYWNTYGAGEVLFFGDLPMVVFARWLAGILKVRCNLDEMNIAHVQAICAFYYCCLHYTDGQFSKQHYEAYGRRINRLLGLPYEKIMGWLNQLEFMSCLQDLTNALSAFVDNPSMRVVNPSFIYNVTMGSWFGSADSRALISVSLEFPPAFIAMVIAAGESSQYRKSVIGQAVEKEKSRWRYSAYVTLVNSSLKNLK